MYDAERVRQTYGYHAETADLRQFVDVVPPAELLVIGRAVPDVRESVGVMRRALPAQVTLPTGLYWFGRADCLRVMAVLDGDAPGSSDACPWNELSDEHPLSYAEGWMDALWRESVEVPLPRFSLHDDVVVTSTGRDFSVRRRRFSGDSWVYEVRADGRNSTYAEAVLAPLEIPDDPVEWVRGPRDSADRFSVTLTREKLTGSFSDTVFSFRATRTLFRAYQFKPVIRMLESGKSRILVADEVGLGKTIEAGLIWTELEARAAADRVLVVCPAALVAKWRSEMEERFNFTLTELSGAALRDFEERAKGNKLPGRFSYVISIERLRTWDGLAELVELAGPLNLAIVDEAHVMRNGNTRSFAAGSLLSEWSEALVLLTATPVNLRNDDLFHLLELLTPGEFGDGDTLEQQLQPNTVMNRVARALSQEGLTGRDRVAILRGLEATAFGAPLLDRPEFALLAELIGQDRLIARDVVAAKRYLADLNVLSSVLTRTRRVEVDEKKAIRDARDLEVEWAEPERTFYEEYVEWCRRRAEAANVPLGFGMQMPLRLASACLPVALDAVLNWDGEQLEITDEDGSAVATARQVPLVAPHRELVSAAGALGTVDTKFEQLQHLLTETLDTGRRALVFTFSRPTLAYLSGRLSGRWRVAVLHGGVPPQRRHEIISDFRAGAYDIVLANRVASEGLDFEFCSVVINYDLPWNPMEVEQRIGRIDRIGQVEDKIVIRNMWCPAALDEQMKSRLLHRIGVFEGSIGALEPIITEHLASLRDAVFDFTLSEAERRKKAEAVLAAIEEQRAGLEDLASASPFLLASGDMDVAGTEQEILNSGRYLGAAELLRLLQDWAGISDAPSVAVGDGGKTLRLRGNKTMAERLRQLVASGRLRAGEVEPYRFALLHETELHLALDHEFARTSRSADLLSARHPLVLAAALVPLQRQARFASVAVPASVGVAPGRYAVLLATARWGAVRPGHEIWGVAVREDGVAAGEECAELLLAALARGELAEGTEDVPPNLPSLVQLASHVMDERMLREEGRKAAEARALKQARRLLLERQHRRRVEAIERRLQTARARDSQGVRLFEAQLRKAKASHETTLADLERQGSPDLTVTPLAVCLMQVRHG